jgi:hypothetical protein
MLSMSPPGGHRHRPPHAATVLLPFTLIALVCGLGRRVGYVVTLADGSNRGATAIVGAC